MFKQQVAEARATTLEQTSARLTAAGLLAVQALLQSLNAESESVKLAAAKAILEQGVRLRESFELEVRIAQLEQQLANQPQGGRRWVG